MTNYVPIEEHIEAQKAEIARQRGIMQMCMKVFSRAKGGSAEFIKAKEDFAHAKKTIKNLEDHIKKLRDEK